MEGDLVTFYGEVRRRMTSKSSPEDFGPEEPTSCDEEETQDAAEYNRLRAQWDSDRRLISSGYTRIKEKVLALFNLSYGEV